MKIKTFTLSIAFLAILSLIAACGSANQQNSQSQSSQPSSSSSSVTSSSEATTSTEQSSTSSQSSNIDGTYTEKDEKDQITLVVTGKTGTWTEVEPDGEKEVKQVTFDPENQRVIIGDDVKIYAVNGNQIIIDDMDREASDRVVSVRVVLTI